MSEDLSAYLEEHGIKVRYMHSSIDTVERFEILNALRRGEVDVVVGINLLREGLDLPEVELVAILDADKEGFLRSESSLIQTIGRAARNLNGRVIMYADKITGSMQKAIDETTRRRGIQKAFNKTHGITPTSIVKAVSQTFEKAQNEDVAEAINPKDAEKLIKKMTKKMHQAADKFNFEKAAELRDEIKLIRLSC